MYPKKKRKKEKKKINMKLQNDGNKIANKLTISYRTYKKIWNKRKRSFINIPS